MKVSVARVYRFRATHCLPSLSAPWNEPHGHLYTVEVKAQAASLDDDGCVVDTDAMDYAWKSISTDYVDRDLNETHSMPTTVENLASELLDLFRQDVEEVVAVTVWEDEDRWGRAQV